MLEPPRTPNVHEANIDGYPWSVSIGMPCAESRLIEKPHVKNELASCQKASVCTASPPLTPSPPAGGNPGRVGAPSAPRPIDSGESRTTRRQRGSINTSTSPAITMYVVRQPVVRISHVTAGTSTL